MAAFPLGASRPKSTVAITENDVTRLDDLGDGVGWLKVLTPKNTLNERIFELIAELLDRPPLILTGSPR